MIANAYDRQGAQGTYDTAPKNVLSSEFDTEKDEEVIKKILQEGTMQSVEVCSLLTFPFGMSRN